MSGIRNAAKSVQKEIVDWANQLTSTDGLNDIITTFKSNTGHKSHEHRQALRDVLRKRAIKHILHNSTDPAYVIRNAVLQFYYESDEDIRKQLEPELKYVRDALINMENGKKS